MQVPPRKTKNRRRVERAISALGVLVFIGVAVAMSRNRKAIDWRMVVCSLLLQLGFALLLLKTSGGQKFFGAFGKLVDQLYAFSLKGSEFVFGAQLINPGGPAGFVFAFRVLPTIIFFASLMNVLYYLGIMQWVVALIAKGIRKLLGTSGAETLCASANIFMGQTEAPLLIRPYVAVLTESELLVLMVSGFATLAAGVMFVYAGMLDDFLPSAAGHLLAASVMSAPSAIMMAKILVPETGEPVTRGDVKIDLPRTESNVIEAAASGASTGLGLALNVGAMLIAFISLVALINGALGLINPNLSLQSIFALVFYPLAWLIGVNQADCANVGNLLGQGLIINEFVAYTDLQRMLSEGLLSGRAGALAIYALCGFTNLSSIAIMIGGVGALAEHRKSDLARLGFLALFAATLTNLQTAALAGAILGEETLTRPAVTAPAASPTPGQTAGEATPAPAPAATPDASASPAPAPAAVPEVSATPVPATPDSF